MKIIKDVAKPIQKGRIRITIRYRTGETVTFEGIYNPDTDMKVITKVLRRRAPKPKQADQYPPVGPTYAS